MKQTQIPSMQAVQHHKDVKTKASKMIWLLTEYYVFFQVMNVK